MGKYLIKDEMFHRSVLVDSDFGEDLLPEDYKVSGGYGPGETVSDKYGNVATFIVDFWVNDAGMTGEDEQAGCTDFGNGWNGLFRDERILINTDSQGFVRARRLDDDEDMDEVWNEILKEAVDSDGISEWAPDGTEGY